MDVSSLKAPRLYCQSSLFLGAEIELSRDQSHYLINVMRSMPGDPVRLFNGLDGEWAGAISKPHKKHCRITCHEQIGDSQLPPDIDYLFAPLKHQRLDYIVQKATEMGARRIGCVITAHTNNPRVNLERMHANAIEAAEQCHLRALPEILNPLKLADLLAQWPRDRQLIFCHEKAALNDPIAALSKLKPGPLAVLIGPEGGFSDAEAGHLCECEFVTPLALGPRIMRADTAGVAVMGLIQAVLGDWC